MCYRSKLRIDVEIQTIAQLNTSDLLTTVLSGCRWRRVTYFLWCIHGICMDFWHRVDLCRRTNSKGSLGHRYRTRKAVFDRRTFRGTL